MARDFHADTSPWQRFAPVNVQAQLSFPAPVNTDLRGRAELVIGRLGHGKTTWGALRAVRLARATGRELYTTGVDWPEPWHPVDSFDVLHEMRNAVCLVDELHLMMPSSKGLLGRHEERFLISWLSLLRKRGICCIGTTQAWTRCATHYRQLVTTVWTAEPLIRGKLHAARGFDRPDDGGRQQIPGRQFYNPAAARIPTNAEVWFGVDLAALDTIVPANIGAGGRDLPAPALPESDESVWSSW